MNTYIYQIEGGETRLTLTDEDRDLLDPEHTGVIDMFGADFHTVTCRATYPAYASNGQTITCSLAIGHPGEHVDSVREYPATMEWVETSLDRYCARNGHAPARAIGHGCPRCGGAILPRIMLTPCPGIGHVRRTGSNDYISRVSCGEFAAKCS